MRWLYHALPRATVEPELSRSDAHELRPASLETEGFVHLSYADRAAESGRLYVSPDPVVLRIDPRRLPSRLEIASTPRGPMPHLFGPIPRDAIVETLELAAFDTAVPDRVEGTRFGFLAFEGMTLLDLVGVLDPVSRIAGMGFDPTSTCEVISAGAGTRVWSGLGATLEVGRVRPKLDDFDVLVIPGGPGARALASDRELIAWLGSFPKNRLAASVCTGSLLWAAEGRLVGKRATTHASAFEVLESLGASVVRERVVEDEGCLTAAGVTSALDLGLALVERFTDEATRARVSAQMEMPGAAL
jgi:putative intracellular protease/amidase/uncharacterized protein (DUF952 family)